MILQIVYPDFAYLVTCLFTSNEMSFDVAGYVVCTECMDMLCCNYTLYIECLEEVNDSYIWCLVNYFNFRKFDYVIGYWNLIILVFIQIVFVFDILLIIF